MEFIRYTSESDIKDLKNHSISLKDFIGNTYHEKDTKEMYKDDDTFPKDWSTIYEVKIIIEDIPEKQKPESGIMAYDSSGDTYNRATTC